MTQLGVIYAIRNKVNGNRYVGATVNERNRRGQHFRDLRAGKHHSGHLQNSFNKYGENNFIFEVLEEVPSERLTAREQFWMDTLQPEYNISKFAGGSNLGVKHSAETRAKISAAGKGRRFSDTHKARIGANWKGRRHTDEARTKMSIARKGRFISAEQRAKMSVAGSRPVKQLDKITGEVIKEWASTKQASEGLGIPRSNITVVCRGGIQKTAGGYKWEYA